MLHTSRNTVAVFRILEFLDLEKRSKASTMVTDVMSGKKSRL